MAAGLISPSLITSCKKTADQKAVEFDEIKNVRPIVICTWDFYNASARAWEILKDGGSSLDAVGVLTGMAGLLWMLVLWTRMVTVARYYVCSILLTRFQWRAR